MKVNVLSHRATMLRGIIFSVWLTSFPTVASADECLIPNSSSPSGKYAVYAVDSVEAYLPAILEIRCVSDQKCVLVLDVGEYVRTASRYYFGNEDKDSIFVLWNRDGSRVAMMIRSGKRNGSLVVYERKKGLFERKFLPDFESKAAIALKIKIGSRYNYAFPEAWMGNDKLSIKVRCDGIELSDAKSYELEFTLEDDLNNGQQSNFNLVGKRLNEG